MKPRKCPVFCSSDFTYFKVVNKYCVDYQSLRSIELCDKCYYFRKHVIIAKDVQTVCLVKTSLLFLWTKTSPFIWEFFKENYIIIHTGSPPLTQILGTFVSITGNLRSKINILILFTIKQDFRIFKVHLLSFFPNINGP